MAHLKGKALLAYVAGIIDGEGSIGLHKNTQKKNPSYTVTVYVGNTNEWLIQFLKMQFGGYITTSSQPNPRAKPIWRWEIRARKAYKFLELILPYLQMKRPQAELAIEFQARRQKFLHLKPEAKVLDEANIILMRSYNQRGIKNKEVR